LLKCGLPQVVSSRLLILMPIYYDTLNAVKLYIYVHASEVKLFFIL